MSSPSDRVRTGRGADYRDAAGRVRTRTRPPQREVVGGWLCGQFSPDLGMLSADARAGRWVLVLGLALLAFGAMVALSLAARGTERGSAVVVPFEVRGSLLYAVDTGNFEFEQFDPESGIAPAIDLDVGGELPLAQFVSVEAEGGEVSVFGAQLLEAEARAGSAVQGLGSSTRSLDDGPGPVVLDLELPLIDAVFSLLLGNLGEPGEETPLELVVTATSMVSGELAGVEFRTPLSQQLVFGLEGRELLLLAESEPVVVSGGEVSGIVDAPRMGSVPLAGDVRLSHLLVAGIAVAVLGLVLIDVVLVASLLERGKSALRRARRRYGHLIVEASTIALPVQVVEVPSMDRLARAAGRLRRPILEVHNGRAVDFVVLEPGIAYCHRVERRGGARPG